MKFKKTLLAGGSALAITVALAALAPAQAGYPTLNLDGTGTTNYTGSPTIYGNAVLDTGRTAGTLVVSGPLQFGGVANNGGTLGTLTNSGTGRINSYEGSGVQNSGSITALGNSGTISASRSNGSSNAVYGVNNTGRITALTNNGTISASVSGGSHNTANGLSNSGSIGTLTNTGTIKGIVSGGSSNTAYGLSNSGTIGALSNSGTLSQITGTNSGLYNVGSIVGIGNGGTISGGWNGLNNQGRIDSLTNDRLISGGSTGLVNSGSIGALTNNGTITGGSTAGIVNGASITALTNNGLISGGRTGIANYGSIGTLSNGGTISGGSSGAAISNHGTITALTNSGRISSGSSGMGVYNDRTIGTLLNTGIISGPYAIYTNTNSISVGHGIGVINNSGVIAGNIYSDSTNNQTINGGGPSEGFGVLTGYNDGGTPTAGSPGDHGAIINRNSDVVFAEGKILLNDDVDVGNHLLTVTNATVRVDNHVTITGAYRQTGGGLLISVASPSSYGYLTIAGSATGNATVTGTQIIISGSGLTAGETFTIVRPSESATGTYHDDTVTISGTNGLKGTYSTDLSNDLVVTLATSSSNYTAKGVATGGVAAPLGAALDQIAAGTSPAAVGFQNNVLSVINVLPTAAQGVAIKQLAPSQTPAVSTSQVSAVVGAVEQHQQTALQGGGIGAAAGSAGHDTALWGQILGGGATRDTTADTDGYRSRDVGLVAGLEHQMNPDLVAGVALSWVKGWSWGASNSSGSLAKTDSYQLTGYATQRFGQAFVDGQLGFGYNSIDQRRSINFLHQEAHADYNAEQYSAKLGAGYDLPIGGVTLTPIAGLRFLRTVSDGYTESGSQENLTVDRRGVQSVTQDLGPKVATSFATDWGKLTPEARLAWVHDYTKGPIASSGIMGGQVFTSTVARPTADGARLNLATTLETDGDLSLKVEYEGEIRHDYQSHTGLLKASVGF